MGLDMYLSAKRYSSPSETHAQIIKTNPIQSCEVSAPVGYWHKANQIHNWFVDNVQNGEDECKPHAVSIDQLTELRDLCRSLLKTRSTKEAQTLLPPASGFFFGCTEIDDWYWTNLEDWYWTNLEDTDRMLSEILSSPHHGDFDYEYRSSW